MTVKLIKKTDFQEISAFWQEAGLHLYPENEEQKRFNDMIDLNPDLCCSFINKHNEIIGTVLGGFDGRTATINRLAISPNEQGKGLGKSLITELEQKLQRRGIKKIAIMIHVSNTQVIPFYEKLGFKEMDYVNMYYKDF